MRRPDCCAIARISGMTDSMAALPDSWVVAVAISRPFAPARISSWTVPRSSGRRVIESRDDAPVCDAFCACEVTSCASPSTSVLAELCDAAGVICDVDAVG